MDRRDFLRFGAGGVGIGAVGLAASSCAVPGPPAPTTLFSSGIAAGLHSDTEVVLWTRLDPLVATPGSVDWEVAPDPTFTSVVASGTSSVGPASDYTVKVLVGGLAPDQSYWYRFVAPSAASAVGRARTLPVAGSSVSQLRLAYASCQCYANGFYTAWRQIATQPVDAVLFLGDYIYESALIQLLRTVREEASAEARTLERLPGQVPALQDRPRPAGRARRPPVRHRLGRPRDRQRLRRVGLHHRSRPRRRRPTRPGSSTSRSGRSPGTASTATCRGATWASSSCWTPASTAAATAPARRCTASASCSSYEAGRRPHHPRRPTSGPG